MISTRLRTFPMGKETLHLDRVRVRGRTHYALSGSAHMGVGFSWPADETDRVAALLKRAVHSRSTDELYSHELAPGANYRIGWMAHRLPGRYGGPLKIAMQGYGSFGRFPDGGIIGGRPVLTVRQWRPIRTAIEQLIRDAAIIESACERGTLADSLSAPRTLVAA